MMLHEYRTFSLQGIAHYNNEPSQNLERSRSVDSGLGYPGRVTGTWEKAVSENYNLADLTDYGLTEDDWAHLLELVVDFYNQARGLPDYSDVLGGLHILQEQIRSGSRDIATLQIVSSLFTAITPDDTTCSGSTKFLTELRRRVDYELTKAG